LPLSCPCFTPPARTALYTLSLHDALPIFFHTRDFNGFLIVYDNYISIFDLCLSSWNDITVFPFDHGNQHMIFQIQFLNAASIPRSEEHTSELQSRFDLVCRLLLEKKKHSK